MQADMAKSNVHLGKMSSLFGTLSPQFSHFARELGDLVNPFSHGELAIDELKQQRNALAGNVTQFGDYTTGAKGGGKATGRLASI